jgi:periplasmic protein TonB
MGHTACVFEPRQQPRVQPTLEPRPPEFMFRSLMPAERQSRAADRGVSLAVSIAVHALLLILALVVPLLVFDDALPATDGAVRAFFAAPPDLAPAAPPPPPPPPAAARARIPRAPAPPPVESARLVAPVEVPEQMPAPDEGMDLGVEGGVPGGVEGGVPGGVVGGVVGGLPQAAPPEPKAKVVRIGGNVRAPSLVHEVRPEYPPLAVQARVQSLVIVEAHVGVDGRVRSVRVLRGHPLLDEAAMEAVRQRRYQPLLLNGVPTEFVLTLTMTFQLTKAAPGS